MSDVVVVGAGIVGASIAYHLARRGVAVTLVDGAPSPAAGVTGGSFGWIGASGGDWPGGAEALRGSVLADHRRLEAEQPEVEVRWTGSLTWADPAESADARGGGVRPGPGQQWVGRAEIAALEPGLRGSVERAVYTPTDGGVDAAHMTGALVRAARTHGAEVVLGSAVTSLSVAAGRVVGVRTGTGFHPAATVVVAAGTKSAELCAPLGVRLPVEVSPALLLRVAAPAGLVRTVCATSAFEVREVRAGHLLMPVAHGERSGAALGHLARRVLGRLGETFHGAGSARLLGYRLSGRPMPVGGPVLGFPTPDRSVYVAVAHSAVTLAPTVGRLVAERLVTGEPVEELRGCRPPGFVD